MPKQSDVTAEQCRALLQRVAVGKTFEKAARGRNLLLFLGEHALGPGPAALTEQDIGTAVFSRPAGYDTSSDTIARVQVSVLRKKLREYFAYEGAAEPVTIDIPSGTYIPEFRRREPIDSAVPASAEGIPAPPTPVPRRAYLRIAIGAGCLLLAGVTGWLLAADRSRPDPDIAAGEALWRPLLNDGREVKVVVSDANLMIVSDMLGRLVTLHEYRHPNYPSSLLESFSDTARRDQARHILGNYYTGIQDARVVNSFAKFGLHYSAPLTLVGAREFSMTPGTPENLILVGNNRGNPWMELFEPEMNFSYKWPESSAVPAIVNRKPLKGEQASYQVAWQEHGYCVVSFRPKPGGKGVALIILGSDLSSLDAGARFVTEEKWLRELQATLGSQPPQSLPFFEVLLETRLLTSGAPEFRLISFRKAS